MRNCRELKQQVQLILNESDFMKRSIILLPAFLAKGLNLTVILWDVDEENFSSQARQIDPLHHVYTCDA